MAWFKQNNAIDDALAANELERAMELLRRLKPSRTTKSWRRQLTRALMQRADGYISSQRLPEAWRDLSTATEFADASLEDRVSKQKTRLVELTIESADGMLQVNKTNHALDLIGLLDEREIADWRADRIREVAQCLSSAERLAALGKLEAAIDYLNKANTLYPELKSLDERIAIKQERQQKLTALSEQLQSSALSCHWDEVVSHSQAILKIAPQHEIAIGAQRHATLQMKRRTSVGSRLTSVPEVVGPGETDDLLISRDSDEAKSVTPKRQRRTTIKSEQTQSRNDQSIGALDADDQQTSDSETELGGGSFLIWVDGVGGYLICTQAINLIGQAVHGTVVSIPLQADVRQRHARIEAVGGVHLIQPLGPMQIDGRSATLDERHVLKTGQTITLGSGVRLAYAQTHPLSKSARMDFVSRHRTQPWSDGIILAGKSIILGPNPNNHIFCPRWKHDLILFRRNDQWWARSNCKFCIDDAPRALEGPIQFNSHLLGEEFSLTLEPVN
jgi:tetratricopeptide (TPR) repeat protein